MPHFPQSYTPGSWTAQSMLAIFSYTWWIGCHTLQNRVPHCLQSEAPAGNSSRTVEPIYIILAMSFWWTMSIWRKSDAILSAWLNVGWWQSVCEFAWRKSGEMLAFLISWFLDFLSWPQYRHKSREMFLADALGKGPSLTRDRNISYISNSAKPKEF